MSPMSPLQHLQRRPGNTAPLFTRVRRRSSRRGTSTRLPRLTSARLSLMSSLLLGLGRRNLGSSLSLLLSSKKLSILMRTSRRGDAVRHDLLCHGPRSRIHGRLVKMLLARNDSTKVLHRHISNTVGRVIGELRPELVFNLPKLSSNVRRHLHLRGERCRSRRAGTHVGHAQSDPYSRRRHTSTVGRVKSCHHRRRVIGKVMLLLLVDSALRTIDHVPHCIRRALSAVAVGLHLLHLLARLLLMLLLRVRVLLLMRLVLHMLLLVLLLLLLLLLCLLLLLLLCLLLHDSRSLLVLNAPSLQDEVNIRCRIVHRQPMLSLQCLHLSLR